MSSIAVAPLPANRFAAFKQFVETTAPEGWGAGCGRLWTFADAGVIAANFCRYWGTPSVVAGHEGDYALQRLAAKYGTDEYNNLCRWTTLARPQYPDDNPYSTPKGVNILYLNAWFEHWLPLFYEHEQTTAALNDSALLAAERDATAISPEDFVTQYFADRSHSEHSARHAWETAKNLGLTGRKSPAKLKQADLRYLVDDNWADDMPRPVNTPKQDKPPN